MWRVRSGMEVEMTLPALRDRLPVLVDEILGLTAGLHPEVALQRIAPLWDAVPEGMGKRALLSARIALMRRAMEAAPVVAEPEPEVVAEPEPVFVPTPLPKPPAVNRALTTLLSLEDAAKLLMAGGEEEEASPAEPEPEPDVVAAPSPERAEAEAELAEVIAREAAAVQKGKGKKKAKPILPDPAAAFAEMGGDAPAPLDMKAAFAAMEDEAPKPPALDLSATFAELSGPPQPKAASASFDLSATFAAMGDDDKRQSPAPEPSRAEPAQNAKPAAAPDLSHALSASGTEDAAAAGPVKKRKIGKAAATDLDLSAQFAAMQGE